MTWTIPEVFAHVRLSLRDPRRAAQELLGWGVPDNAVWPFAVLSVVLLTLGAELISAAYPPPADQPAVYIAPLALAVLSLASLATLALAVQMLGRVFGGRAEFLPTLLVMTWIQFVMFWVFVPLELFGFLPPVLIDMLTLAALLYMLWVMVSFVAVLHGFEGLGMPLVVVILSLFLVSIVFLFVLGAVGVTVVGAQSGA